MPIYEYQCSTCGHQLEIMQKMSDEPLKECPNCQKLALHKLISATSFQLKGTGWYATDFRDKGKPPKPEDKERDSLMSDSVEKKTEAKNVAGTDTLPQAKTEDRSKKEHTAKMEPKVKKEKNHGGKKSSSTDSSMAG